jgi:hypothetical protein
MMYQSRERWATDIGDEYEYGHYYTATTADDGHRTNAESDRKEAERLRPEAESRLAKIRDGTIDLKPRFEIEETSIELATRKKKLIRTLSTLERLMLQVDAAWEDLVAAVDACREAVK